MLQPKKTKFRRQQKGRMKGNAHRGAELAFGSFGIKTLACQLGKAFGGRDRCCTQN